MELERYLVINDIRIIIQLCEKHKHVQQVAYSTYHDSLTQVCFTCDKVRTSTIIMADDE